MTAKGQGTVGGQGAAGGQGVAGGEGAAGCQGEAGGQGTAGGKGAVGGQGTAGVQGAAGCQGEAGGQGTARGKGGQGGERTMWGRFHKDHQLESNMIRVFISSSLSDMNNERRALLERAGPELLLFCRRLGLYFEAVDPCWGFRSSLPFSDHETCDVLLEEICRSRRTSAGPYFTALLGNRYGHRALPRSIPEQQFQVLLSKLTKNVDGVKLLTQWFLKDTNAVPPTFILQPITVHFPHYSDLRPESSKLRDKDLLSWKLTESRLLQTLRTAADQAEASAEMTREQKHQLYTSGTEQEIELGLLKSGSETTALVMIRDISRQRRDGPKRLSRFVDLTSDGMLDAEAQGLLTALKSRLQALPEKNVWVHSMELSKGGIDPKNSEHAQYLSNACQRFVSHMKAEITEVVENRTAARKTEGSGASKDSSHVPQWLMEEVRGGVTCCAELGEGIYGRDASLGKLCLAMWESTNTSHRPLVVHGGPGMGKTALLCRLVKETQALLEDKALLVIRLLAEKHNQRTDIDHLLLSIYLQVSLAVGVTPPSSVGGASHLALRRLFEGVLLEASQRGHTLLLVLDSVDCLSDRQQAPRLRWLPLHLPPNVHLIVSMETSSEAFANARLRLSDAGSFLEVEPLTQQDGALIAESYLRGRGRALTPAQMGAVLHCFQSSGCPLHLRLMLSTSTRWPSYMPTTALSLGENTKEVMSQLLLALEEKHGKELVGGALVYITLSREGLLEAELCDIMSLDDDIIKEVYMFSLPPTPSVIRLPALLWARLRWDLRELLEERWSRGVALLTFSHRRVMEAVATRYLSVKRRGRSLRLMSEYFLGRWAGKLRPASLPGLSLLLSDRKVPPQPTWFAPGLANVRKLQELPYHLLHAGLLEELQQEVIGCADWLYCKSSVCGVSSVIQDLDQVTLHMVCPETRTESSLIRDALALIRPSLELLRGHMDVCLFYTELLSRLSSLADPFPAVIGRLCAQCEEWLMSCSDPTLTPRGSFLQQPGGALLSTLSAERGAVQCIAVAVQMKLLVCGCDDGVVLVWSLTDRQLIHTLLGHTATVLLIKVINSSADCLSLAADGSLRRWSLINGLQLLCVEDAVPVDTAPSLVHLHLTENLLFVYTRTQVKVWEVLGAELHLLSNSGGGDEAWLVLGVLGEHVVVLCNFSQLKLCHPITGEQVVEAPPGDAQRRLTPATSLTLHRRGMVMVASKQGFLHQIFSSGQHTAAEFPLIPTLMSTNEEENILLAGGEYTLSVFRITSSSVCHFLSLQHDDHILSVSISSDCRVIATGAADQLLRVWSVTTGALMDTLCGSDAPITAVLFYYGLIVSASSSSDSALLWDPKYDTRHRPLGRIPAGSAHSAITKDGDSIFYVRHQSHMTVSNWNSLSGSVCEALPLSAELCVMGVAQTRRLLLCGLSGGTVLIFPLASPQDTLCIPPPLNLSNVVRLAVGEADQRLAVAYEDAVSLFMLSRRDGVPCIEGPTDTFPLSLLHAAPSAMALLPDHRLLYGTGCGAVMLRRFGSEDVFNLEPHGSTVTCVTASNAGKLALVGSEDGVQRLWAVNPLTLEHTMECKGFFEGVLCASFSDNDQFIFTGSQDRTIKVWDVSTGNLLYVQYVYSSVVQIVSGRSGFVALTRWGSVIRETFRCPDRVSPDYNPLKNVKAQYRLISRDKSQDNLGNPASDLQDFNPAHVEQNVLTARPSPTCIIL